MASDLSATFHNLASLLEGKSTFSQFAGDEVALIERNIASLPAVAQPVLNGMLATFQAGASALVGAGLTIAGPILSQSTDTQTTELLNLLSALGVPTTGPFSVAEQAAISTAITTMKAALDHAGLQILTGSTATPVASPAPVASPQP